MKKALLFLIPFLLIIVVVVAYFKLTQKISTLTIPNIPAVSFSDLVKFSRFSLEKAPSQSLVGRITSINGEVDYTSRLATESAKIFSPQEIQQGESLATGSDGSLTLTFEKAAQINMQQNSSLGVIQTLPVDLVFAQSSGTIEYNKLAQIPVSIRSYHLLTENNGDITISINSDKPTVSVTINSGSAIFAYNDINNDSKVLTVESGKNLTFNDTTRRVAIK